MNKRVISVVSWVVWFIYLFVAITYVPFFKMINTSKHFEDVTVTNAVVKEAYQEERRYHRRKSTRYETYDIIVLDVNGKDVQIERLGKRGVAPYTVGKTTDIYEFNGHYGFTIDEALTPEFNSTLVLVIGIVIFAIALASSPKFTAMLSRSR